jgi:hypothetical protein
VPRRLAVVVPTAAVAAVAALLLHGSGPVASGTATRTHTLSGGGVTAPASTASSSTTTSTTAPARRTTGAITLEWVGDMAFGTQFGLPPDGLAGSLAPLRPTLEDADLTIGNLEGVIASGGASKCGAGSANCFSYEAPPSYARQYRELGFDVLNQANNHALDFGAGAELQTTQLLAAQNMAVDGHAGEISIVRSRGLRVAVLGFAPYKWANSLLDLPAAQALVRRAGAEADVIVAIIHAGAEGAAFTHVPHGEEYAYGEDRGDARAFSHAVIDAGASIVLGSGPHVIRGVERYRGRMIAYSLGDFACWNNLALGGVLSESAILRVTITPGGRLVAGHWIPVELVAKGIPRADPAGASAQLVEQLSVEDFGDDRYRIHADGVIDPGPIGR